MFNLFSIFVIFIIPIIYKIRAIEGGCDVSNALGVSPTLQLSTGSVQGLSCVSQLSLPYFSFRGIPYASPPVGNLRFKAPQPLPSWEGILKANVEAPACLQPSEDVAFPITYSEDCLFVNVFTPYLKHPSNKLMPVIVWIHGGKFYLGSGSSYKYGPDFLIEKNVVVVTFNYRLGVFGFLNMNTPEAQGNAGMKDTVSALRWVQREISSFGGDPKLVTIFGGSSGATSINLLLVSSITKGLFSRAIAHSGGALNLWNIHHSNYNYGLKLADTFNCSTLTPKDIVTCLQKVNGVDLAEKQMMFEKMMHGEVKNPFLPTIEEGLGEEVFLSDYPNALSQQTLRVPFLTGVVSGEGFMGISDPEEVPDQFANITDLLLQHLPSPIFDSALPVLQRVLSDLRGFYFGNSTSFLNRVLGFVDYVSDIEIIHDVVKTAKTYSVRAPVYMFYFAFEGDFLPKDHYFKKLNVSISGVCHGDDLAYFFFRNYTIPDQNNLFAHPRDMNVIDKLTTMWTNFATYGDPTPFQPQESNTTWLSVKRELTQYLYIGNDTYMVRKPIIEERMAFWDKLFSHIHSKSTSTSTPNTLLGASLLVCAVIIAVVYIRKYFRRRGYTNWNK